MSELMLELEDLPARSLVEIVFDEGARTPEGEPLRTSTLYVIDERDDGLIHCCFSECGGEVCAGMVYDEITGRELEPDALPAIEYKSPGTRIVGVLNRG